MIPDFPIDIRIRLAELKFILAASMSIGKPGIIKFEFQQLRFHGAHPNLDTVSIIDQGAQK